MQLHDDFSPQKLSVRVTASVSDDSYHAYSLNLICNQIQPNFSATNTFGTMKFVLNMDGSSHYG